MMFGTHKFILGKNNNLIYLLINITIIIIYLFFLCKSTMSKEINNAWRFKFEEISGSEINLSDYKGKVILIVNTASFCGYTNQYSDLQNLWDKNKSKDFILIGVPSDDFGNQEFKENDEIKNFCETNFFIDFPLTAKTNVKGDDAHPFFMWAKKELGIFASPKWNFHKYVIDKNGNLSNWFSSVTKPNSKKFIDYINTEINKDK